MEKREFFATQSIWVRFIPSTILTCVLFFGPWVLWEADPEFRDVFGLGFARFMAIAGLFMLYVYFRAAAMLSRNPVPLLTLDTCDLSTPLGAMRWDSLGTVTVKRIFGCPRLCISTTNDAAYLTTLKPALAFTVGLRRWLFGAPIVIPPLRDATYAEVCSLIDRYRSAALTTTV